MKYSHRQGNKCKHLCLADTNPQTHTKSHTYMTKKNALQRKQRVRDELSLTKLVFTDPYLIICLTAKIYHCEYTIILFCDTLLNLTTRW
uniref:Uncharacterized protein n=1 Tax=Pyxicephalus adspersus TaxID=30357 RepID=A0AAV2ZSN6_PYXAD|nr:TPA: hypothetical protein GDO54_018093 [Pyxicephalus adspersus]